MDFNQFMENMKANDFRPSMPQPKKVKPDGKNGGYVVSVKTDSGWENKSRGDWKGVVLEQRYMVQWKYDPDSRVRIFSKEFADFNDPITILKIEGENRTEKTYQDYYFFKDAVCRKDEMTGKVSSPFDFYVSLYVLDIESDEVVQLRVRGTSRGEWFNFNPTSDEIPHRIGAVIEFSTEERQGPQGPFHTAIYSVSGKVEGELQEKVMKAHGELLEWLGGWQKKAQLNAPEVKAIEAPMPNEDEYQGQNGQIDVQDIQF